jgi:hypothetical protein
MALQSRANQKYIQIQGQKNPFSMAGAAKKSDYWFSESDLLKSHTP